MKYYLKFRLTLLLLASFSLSAFASEQSTNEFQQISGVISAVEKFIYAETKELPGDVIVSPRKIDNRITLPKCLKLSPFIPTGGRLWGNTSVGVRCEDGATWTIHVQVDVQVMADVVHVARPLTRNQALAADDINLRNVNLTQMPAGIFTDPSQVIGKVAIINLSSGQPIRQQSLRSAYIILRGQKVKLQVKGSKFTISSEGHALADASEGQVVQVRNHAGRVISGLARINGIVDIQP